MNYSKNTFKDVMLFVVFMIIVVMATGLDTMGLGMTLVFTALLGVFGWMVYSRFYREEKRK